MTEPLQGGGQHLFDVVFVRDVGGNRDGRRAFTRKLPQNFFRFADRLMGMNRDLITAGCERPRHTIADLRRPASDYKSNRLRFFRGHAIVVRELQQ